jgi:DNA-binding MarR family transcriptional regulator
MMAVPEYIVSRDRLIEWVQDGRTPAQIAEMFRVDPAIIRDMIRRLEQNGYYDLLHKKEKR